MTSIIRTAAGNRPPEDKYNASGIPEVVADLQPALDFHARSGSLVALRGRIDSNIVNIAAVEEIVEADIGFELETRKFPCEPEAKIHGVVARIQLSYSLNADKPPNTHRRPDDVQQTISSSSTL